jgi:hypothetical protein
LFYTSHMSEEKDVKGKCKRTGCENG